MKEISIKMSSVEVKLKTRKLRANWSQEIITDINNTNGFYGLDEKMAKELASAIRREYRQKSIINIFPD
jgi:hypothetical protein